MTIEFIEKDKNFHEIFVDGEFTGVEIIVCTPGNIVLDPLGCLGAFDIRDVEQILAKMKELRVKNS